MAWISGFPGRLTHPHHRLQTAARDSGQGWVVWRQLRMQSLCFGKTSVRIVGGRAKMGMEILRAHDLMMRGRMVFGKVIGSVVFARAPINVKLLLRGAVT